MLAYLLVILSIFLTFLLGYQSCRYFNSDILFKLKVMSYIEVRKVGLRNLIKKYKDSKNISKRFEYYLEEIIEFENKLKIKQEPPKDLYFGRKEN